MSNPRKDDGFTLVELVISILILGVIALPLGGFIISYFSNYQTTTQRLSDSHDIQIATAYVSQDVANTGLHSATAPFAAVQSAWLPTSPSLPATYCGQTVGTLVVLLRWDSWTVPTAPPPPPGGVTGTNNPSSAAYVTTAGTLHRVYCSSGTTTTSDATIVHNLQAATVSCPTACDGPTPPSTFSLSLTISGGPIDKAAPTQPVVLTGQRRQT